MYTIAADVAEVLADTHKLHRGDLGKGLVIRTQNLPIRDLEVQAIVVHKAQIVSHCVILLYSFSRSQNQHRVRAKSR